MNFAIPLLLITIANPQPSEPFLLSSALAHVSFPAVPATKPAVEEVVALPTGNLETNEIEAFSRDNRLLTFTAQVAYSEFHGSPPEPCLLFLVGKLVSKGFQILIRLL